MKVVSRATAIPQGRPVSAALGMFDGVHLGHQHVIRQALLDARASNGLSLVITFDPHPLSVVHPDRAPALLQTHSQRLRAIAELGIETILVIPFTRAFSLKTGEEFIRRLARDLGNLKSLSVGQGFHFGHGRSGNTPLLRALGTELGFVTHALAAISIGGETVSSTRIRQALRDGDFAHAAELLGRPYALQGSVVRGDGRGRQWGYPTANLEVRGLELPPVGVYAAWVRTGRGQHAGAVNVGRRPTIERRLGELKIEVHLLDFSGDLYGQELEIEFVRSLRGERKFPDIEALRRQIARDVKVVGGMLR